MSYNEIRYIVEPYTKQQMMDMDSEVVEMGATDERNEFDLDRAFWRIDYRTGIAIFWSDNSEDVEDLIRYAGTAQSYLKQRGCEDIIQENDARTRYTFKPIAGA